jgi:hypothetical protein
MDIFAAAKFALPQAFSDRRRWVRAPAVFIGGEGPAHEWIDAQNLKEAGGNHFAMQAFRFSIAGKIESDRTVSSHARERGVHSPPMNEVGIRDGSIFEVGHLLEHGYELVGPAKGKGIEKHTIYDGEDCGIGPDAESQSKNCDQGKTRRLGQYANAITQVLRQRFQEIGGHKIFDCSNVPG